MISTPLLASSPKDTGGPLAAFARKVYAGKKLTDCDSQNAAWAIEIATALDERADWIAQERLKRIEAQAEANLARIDLGRFSFIDSHPASPPASTEASGIWSSETASWKSIWDPYVALKAAGLETLDEESTLKWLSVDEEARSILLDDEARLLKQEAQRLKHDQIEPARALNRLLYDCFVNGLCDELNRASALAPELAPVPEYAAGWSRIKAAQSAKEKYKAVEELTRLTHQDLLDRRFLKNPAVRRIDAGTFILPLDGSAFGEGRDRIQEVIERFWHNDRFRVQVEWTTRAQNPKAYDFQILDAPGTRGYAIPDQTRIYLPSGLKAYQIAHEAGHALGFPDQYYTVWDPGACRYTSWFSKVGLMSDGESVTDADWKQLDESYR